MSWPSGFIPRMQGWLGIRDSINTLITNRSREETCDSLHIFQKALEKQFYTSA